MEETATQHIFPLPEVEKHKLDDVQEKIGHLPVHPTVKLKHQATRRVVDSFVRANPGMIIGASLVAGFFCGFGYGRRR